MVMVKELLDKDKAMCLNASDFKSHRSMEEWIEAAKTLKFETVADMLWILYVDNNMGLRQLDKFLGFSETNLRKKLLRIGVKIKRTGGSQQRFNYNGVLKASDKAGVVCSARATIKNIPEQLFGNFKCVKCQEMITNDDIFYSREDSLNIIRQHTDCKKKAYTRSRKK